jgi:zinc transporter, ZIP family
MLTLILAASATALATGLGAIPVFFLSERAAALRPLLLGVAAGTMAVASVAGLLLPGLDEGTLAEVAAGFAGGACFLLATRRALDPAPDHLERARSAGVRTSILVFVVLLSTACPKGSRSVRPTRLTPPG